MAAFLKLKDKSDLQFHVGHYRAPLIAATLRGVESFYVDGDELENVKRIIESAGLKYLDTGRSKTIVANTNGERALIALLLMNW